MVYILIFSLALRLVFINQSLWLDESLEALALRGHFGSLLSYSLSDFQPPFYHFILLFWTKLAGFSEFVLRLPSLLAGLFTVYFVIKLAELLGNKKVGTIVGFLAATNPLLIYYSQEGRTYAMTTFFVTASFYYFIKLLQSKKRDLPSTIYYLLSTTAFLWTSYLSWFVLLSQVIYVLWKKRYSLLIPQLFSALTLIFWIPSLFSSLAIGMGDVTNIPGWGRVVGGISLKSLALTWVKMNIGRISFENNYFYGFIVGALALLHAYILRKSRSSILILWILAPVILASFISLWVPVYSYTRVLFIVPAYLLLLSLGLSHLPRFYSSIVLLLNLVFLSIFWFSPRFHREDWRTLTQYLNTQAGTVILPSLKQDAPFLYYNLSLPLSSSTDLSLSSPNIFYVKYVEEVFDPSRLGYANLAQLGYTLTTQRVYTGIQMDVYEK